MAVAAPTRAKVNTIKPISARSRSPAIQGTSCFPPPLSLTMRVTAILSSSVRASSAVSTGVLPFFCFHGGCSPDAREGKHHQTDQRPIAQACHAGDLLFSAALELDHARHRNTIQQRARMVSREHRRLALLLRILRPAHGVG